MICPDISDQIIGSIDLCWMHVSCQMFTVYDTLLLYVHDLGGNMYVYLNIIWTGNAVYILFFMQTITVKLAFALHILQRNGCIVKH